MSRNLSCMTFFLIMILFLPPAFAESPGASDTYSLAKETKETIAAQQNIAVQIAAMHAKDLHARSTFLAVMKNNPLTPEEQEIFIGEIWPLISKIDAENTSKLKNVLEKHSWSDLAQILPNTAQNAWVILQHSPDEEFQMNQLPQIELLVREKKLDGSALANLSDRVALSRNEPQTFGTQVECRNSKWLPIGIDNFDAANEKRASLGLEPLEIYLEDHVKLYGPCAQD